MIMRFSLLQFLIFVTAISVLCAVLVHVPVMRGIFSAFAVGGVVSLLAVLVDNMRRA
jgi:hypothetical protein